MKYKKKVILLLLLVSLFLLKEEIFGMYIHHTFLNTEESICHIEVEDIQKKYQELVNAYQYNDITKYPLEHSKILFRNIYNLNDKITIYKGSANSIEEKNLVINEEGLVGIVSKVHKNSSEVSLLKSEDLQISVLVGDFYGILKYKNEEFIIEGINNKAEIQIGDKVVTSDLSIYPENVFIGEVEEVYFDHYEIEKIIKVRAAVHFDDLKYVSVIKNLRGIE